MPLVLDYDGNLTEVEEEAIPFLAAYAADLGRIIQAPAVEVQQQLLRLTIEALAADPATFGWVFGKDDWIMAPAQVDPYLRNGAASRRLLHELGMPRQFLNGLLDALFLYNYMKTADVPKEDTVDLLRTIHTRGIPAAIVTNSGTTHVLQKLRGLLGKIDSTTEWWIPRLFGSARKMDPDEYTDKLPDGTPITNINDQVRWDLTLPSKVRYDVFPRETVIQRPHYLKRLWKLKNSWEQQFDREIEWSEILVVGDIFELDLALPLVLGCHIGFMVNEHTPRWELDFISTCAKGRVLYNVEEILPYYDWVQNQPR